MTSTSTGSDRGDGPSIAAGAAAWVLLAASAAVGRAPLGIIEVLLLGGPLVVVPLGLALARRTAIGLPAASDASGTSAAAAGTGRRTVGAGLVAVAFLLPAGPAAAVLTVPWLACTLALVPAAARRLLRARRPHGGTGPATTRDPGEAWSEVLTAIGVLWLPLAAAAITATRGWPEATLLGVSPELVRLTGVHLDYAGFGAALIAAQVVGAASRLDRRPRLAETAAALTAGGAVVVAVGHLTVRGLELAGALAVTAGVIGLGAASWSLAPRRSLARALLRVSGLSVLASMGFAVAYAWALTVGAPHLPYATIAAVHGTINALGFTVAGLLGWCAAASPGEGQASRRVRSSSVSRRTTTRERPSRTKTTAGRGSRL